MFLVMKIRENIKSMCQKKYFEDKHVDLLFSGEGEKKHYVFIKDYNIFVWFHTAL